MIDIISFKGELYRYDPETERIFKDGRLIPSTEAEPVYSNVDNSPSFSGIYLKGIESILSRSGKINSITDINSVY
jgi:hypothetical protein